MSPDGERAAEALLSYARHLDVGAAALLDGDPTDAWQARCQELDAALRAVAGPPLREVSADPRGPALLAEVQSARARFAEAAAIRREAVLEGLAEARIDRRAQRAYGSPGNRTARYLTRRA